MTTHGRTILRARAVGCADSANIRVQNAARNLVQFGYGLGVTSEMDAAIERAHYVSTVKAYLARQRKAS